MSDVGDRDLILHLPLAGGDVADAPLAKSIVNHHVKIGRDFSTFNGRNAYLEIAGVPELRFGNDDFSVALQIATESDANDAVGDLVSMFDPAERRGFHLSVKHHAGAVTSQTNFRNLHFEVDAATQPTWFDYGRPGNAVAVWGLAVHRGHLYAGTYEPGADECGRVHRHLGDDRWECCGPLDGSNTVSALAVFEGRLYAATKLEDPHGSLLDPSANSTPGGNVYQLNEDGSWTHCGKVCEADNLFGLTVFGRQLYAWPAYAKGVYRYAGDKTWQLINSPDSRLLAMSPYHGELFAAANRLALLDPNVTHAGPDGDPSVQAIVGQDGVYRLTADGKWIGCGNQGEETQIYSLGTHRGSLFVGTWPSGKVFRYDGDRRWHDCGRLGDDDEVMGLAVYNGMLYAGGLPSSAIYRYDGDNRWTNIGQADETPNVPLRRAVNMAVYRGRLCVGTLPAGHVRAIQVGQVASHDWTLPAGWRSIVAVRRQGSLFLYLDGQLVAESISAAEPLNVNTGAPLLIGFGGHDYFTGRMRDLRIYRRALSENEAVKLSALLGSRFNEGAD